MSFVKRVEKVVGGLLMFRALGFRARLAEKLGHWAERVRPGGTEVVLAALSPRLRRMRMRSFCAECTDPYHREDGQCGACREHDRKNGYGDFDPRFAGPSYWEKDST